MSVYRIIGRNIWRRTRKPPPRNSKWFAHESWQAWRQRLADEYRRLVLYRGIDRGVAPRSAA